ncbi:MAG: hypothetical protein IT537_03120 [Hyphomicrobiales bacterium]|nr:hypothetical protein [Hyphomicrobiales bacterium]
MNDNLKMAGRYAIAIGVSFAVGRGWITPDMGGAVSNLLVEMGGVLIAFGPAVYAAWKVNNAPKA